MMALAPLKTLADFKRSVANGDTYVLTWHEYYSWTEHRLAPAPHKYLGVPRRAEKVQTARWRWEGGSWMDFGKASQWTFDGNVATYAAEHVVLRYERSGQ